MERGQNRESDPITVGNKTLTGRVKWFNSSKGFGFITRDDDGPDAFVHHSGVTCPGSFQNLVAGEEVQFEVVKGDKGPCAVNVTKVGQSKLSDGSTRGQRRNRGARRYTKRCYNCDEDGHKVNDCRKPRRQDRICHNCGSTEHLIRKCPKLLTILARLKHIEVPVMLP